MIRNREQSISYYTAIIAMIAYSKKSDRDKCLEAGMDDYISKPIDIDKLFKKIDRFL